MMPYELEELKAKENKTPQKKIANNFIQNILSNDRNKNKINILKIVWYLAKEFNKCNLKKEFNTFTIKEKDIKKDIDIDSKVLRRNLKSMMKITITFINEIEEYEEYKQLIPGMKINYDGIIEIDMYTSVAKMVIDVVHKNTTFIDINQVLKLNNHHSIRLLPFLYTINNYDEEKGIKRQKTVDLKWCNAFFGTKYKRLKQIEVEILSKVKEEMDNNSTLTFDYKMNKRPVGKGRPGIQDITIIPKANNNYQTTIFSNFEETATATKKPKSPTPTKAIDNTLTSEQLRIEKIQNWNPTYKELDLEIEYGIAQQMDDGITAMFKMYISEQIDVFKKYCIDEKKNYRNMTVSFRRHIQNAYKLRLDFFSTYIKTSP